VRVDGPSDFHASMCGLGMLEMTAEFDSARLRNRSGSYAFSRIPAERG
jgi:hypothetical protein